MARRGMKRVDGTGTVFPRANGKWTALNSDPATGKAPLGVCLSGWIEAHASYVGLTVRTEAAAPEEDDAVMRWLRGDEP